MSLDIQSVSFFYSQGRAFLPALDGVDAHLQAGEFVCLLGPSGCGKSTLIRMIGGLLQPTSGQILFKGAPITEPNPEIGMMFQEANLLPWRTVSDNIGLALELTGWSKARRNEKVQSILPMLGLANFADAYPAELSGGMAQRAALGRLLVQNPELILMDEPFGALDALTRERISLDLLKIWDHKRPAVLMVTHDIQEAVLLADRIWVMSARPGRIVAEFKIDLPRPRTMDLIYESEFLALSRSVRETILFEA